VLHSLERLPNTYSTSHHKVTAFLSSTEVPHVTLSHEHDDYCWVSCGEGLQLGLGGMSLLILKEARECLGYGI